MSTSTARRIRAHRNRDTAPSHVRLGDQSQVGARIAGRYRLLELIAEGGMGWVFRAEQLPDRRPVAVKLLHPEMARYGLSEQRFEREAEAVRRLSHRNIVEIIEFGRSGGRLFLAMELLAGVPLDALLGRGGAQVARPGGWRGLWARASARVVDGKRRAIGRTLAIMDQVLDALAHAHGRGVVHRDLKPDNIMLLPGGRVKLLDFGLAKLSDDEARPVLTQAGTAMGTPHYMSPEQAAGERADARADVYACGVILYELLTGRRPFFGPSTTELLTQHLTATPPSLRVVAPAAEIPEALERVVLRALAKKPADRYPSAAALRQALGAAVETRWGSLQQRRLGATLLAAAMVLVMLAHLAHRSAARPLASLPAATTAGTHPAPALWPSARGVRSALSVRRRRSPRMPASRH